MDVGLVTEDDKTRIIDRSKLRRERERCRNEIRSEEQQDFGLVNAVYLDGRKDATQIVAQGPNEKDYRSVQLEEHYTVVGEPGSYYLTHFSPEDGKGRTIAQKLIVIVIVNFYFWLTRATFKTKKAHHQTRKRKTATKRYTLKHAQFLASLITRKKQ